MALTTAAVVAAGSMAYGATQSKTSKSKFKEDPFIRDASVDAINRARSIADRPYTPYTGQRVAGLSGNEQQAYNLAGTMGDQIQPFQRRLQRGFTPGVLRRFENPYLDRVLQNQQRVIGEEWGRQATDLQTRQSAMNAFRTGRSDLARARLDEARLRALGDAEATGRAGAFDRALGAYFQQQGLDIGSIGAITGANQAQIGALSQTGLAERGIRQAGLDFDYGQFLEQRDWDVNNLGPLLAAIQAARGNSERSMTEPGEDPWSSYGGLLASLLGGGGMGAGAGAG